MALQTAPYDHCNFTVLAAVVALSREMDDGRRLRLNRLGFSVAEAARLSALHTRNFM